MWALRGWGSWAFFRAFGRCEKDTYQTAFIVTIFKHITNYLPCARGASFNDMARYASIEHVVELCLVVEELRWLNNRWSSV